MNHLVTCDCCGNEFYVMVRERVIDKEADNVIQSYIRCPVCHHEYTISYVNDTVRRLQRIQRDIRMSDNKNPRYVEIQYNINKKRIKQEMENLKNKYSLKD